MAMSRRQWLVASAAAASAPLHRAARAEPSAPRTIGLGFSLYGMRSLTIDSALRALAEIGYDCVELPVMPDWPADSVRFSRDARRDLRAQLADRRLRLTSLMENLPATGDDAQHRANVERLRLAAEMASELAGDKKPLIETILGGRPGEFDAVKERLADRLRDLAKIAAEAQVTLAVKAHIGNATQQPEQLLWLLGQVASPWLVATYDYSHFQLQNFDMKTTTDALLPRSRFIHVKDTEHAQGKRGFLLPGEGSIDYVQLLKLVRQSTYQGDVVVEASSQVFNRAGYEALAAASKCYNHLAGAFSRAGIKRG
jgi:sugar phosphate isomerase/epimerase